MSTLTAWLLVNDHREAKDIPQLWIYAVGTCIAKLKPLVENMNNKKQGGLEINGPTYKAGLLSWLQLSLQMNLMAVGELQKILVEKKIIEMKKIYYQKSLISLIWIIYLLISLSHGMNFKEKSFQYLMMVM